MARVVCIGDRCWRVSDRTRRIAATLRHMGRVKIFIVVRGV